MIPDHTSTSASRLQITDAEAGDMVSLRLVGELDAEEETKLRDAVAEVVGRNPGRLIGIDAAELTFLDSSGIRALLNCHDQAEKAGCRLSITAAGTIVYQVLQITGLLHLFDVPGPQQPTALPGDRRTAGRPADPAGDRRGFDSAASGA